MLLEVKNAILMQNSSITRGASNRKASGYAGG